MNRSKDEKTAPENPYFAGRREWNERYGSYIAQARTWRLVAFASMAISAVAVAGVVWQAGQSKVIPYVVQTNSFGDVVGTRRADVAQTTTAPQVKAQLRRWAIGARTIYVDRRAQESLLNDAYNSTFPDSPAWQALTGLHRESNPYERATIETVDIAVNSILPLTDQTWRVEWTETTRQRSGKATGVKNWQATVTVVNVSPTTEQQLSINPLGIYVQTFSWAPRI